MPNTREKLIELLETVVSPKEVLCDGEVLVSTSRVADHLIAYGVTIQKWIPVTERLPEEPLQMVLVTNGKMVCVGVYSVEYDEFGVMCGRGRGQDKRFGVTHWMPLAEPPKEVEHEDPG